MSRQKYSSHRYSGLTSAELLPKTIKFNMSVWVITHTLSAH